MNQQTPHFCVEKIERALNDLSKPVRGSRVLLLGMSYKPGIGDIRESPALKILAGLREQGADVRYHDPYVPELVSQGLTSAADLDEAVEDAELAVIVTAHPGIDHMAIAQAVPTVDLRGVTRAARAVEMTGAMNGKV